MRILLIFVAVLAYAQDLPVIHLPPEAAQVLQQAYQHKVEAERAYAVLEWQAVRAFATQPGGGYAGSTRVVTADPLHSWEWGAIFSVDFAVMIPQTKPLPGVIPACPEYGSHSTEVDTIPITPWLPPKQ